MAKTKGLTFEEKLKEALIPKEEQPYEIPENWEWVNYRVIFSEISSNNKKIQQKNYLKVGKIAIVDQGKDLIGGYTNNMENPYKEELPVVVFGDHTLNIKYIDFPFYIGADGVKVLKTTNSYNTKFLYYFLKNLGINKLGYRRHFSILKTYFFVLPPLEEQKRIVNKLDSMFEKINKAKESIQEVKENIENRKKSILNKAFKGELTAEWRKNNQTEDAIELLKSINEEKVKNWEQECIEAEKNGKKKPSKPKIEEIQNMIISKEKEPYEIPKNWKWVKLGEIIDLISGQDVSNTLCNSEGRGIPYILGASNLNNEIFVAERWIEKPRVISKKNNILLSVKGTIGKIYLQKEEAINLSRQIMALKTGKNIFNKWLKYFLNNIVNEIKEKGNGLIPGISREIVLNIRTPLPPLEEQQEIVRILDEILEKESKIKELIELEEAIELLEKSILDKAFRGKLGTQNKDDEPAIELLKKYYNLK